MDIRLDDLRSAKVAALLQEHLDDMAKHSPPENIHALDLERLRRPEITFWTVWESGQLLGCSAIRQLDAMHGEIKSMRTSKHHRRKGVAAFMLQHILDEAARRGYRRLSLETGSPAAFEPARQLYARFGFTYCGPFGEYVDTSYSVFMTRAIRGA
ncbi:GNAT family N-acetyltransferase [Dyella japonica]|uniref:Acetyltransferase n=1 Tax=Dyella japonica A8 TaxID=1217721 RepID=A0A075JZZ0_9GAMM|nr:GNAT family N-acetyltransferase [Dyella japonica]AIF47110.1 acetyltransferase [Dyella japonica A8]